MNTNTKNIIIVFFLILFCNSIFAQGVNLNTLNFAESTTTQKVIFDRGNGCSTVELPESSVNALWEEILTKGFSADEITSDQAANTNRDTLDQNNILLTNPDAKAGDMAIKQEVPSKLMNPLETPTILGQSCYGPYQFGVNLQETLRIGRCTGTNPDSECYLTQPGLYRKNDLTGFFKEAKVVVKDSLQGIKETIVATGDSNKEKLFSEDLGVFSETSNAEINSYLSAMEANDLNSIDVETYKVMNDKAIQNSTITRTFSVSMQTTCRGENCYINTYTLFDKMFNQYYSLDMVYSATTPFIYGGLARIANNPSVKKVLTKPNKILKDKKLIKEGGFLDTLTKDPALFVQDPFGRVRKSIDAGKYARADVDTFITRKIDPLNNTAKRDIEHYKIDDYMKDMLSSTQKGMGDTSKFTSENIVKNAKKLTAAQRRAVTDAAQIFGDNVNSANALLKSKMVDPNFKSAKEIIDKAISAQTPVNDIYSQLTRAQLDAYTDVAYTASRLADTYDIASFKTFKWKETYGTSAIVDQRSFDSLKENIDTINQYRSKDGHTFGKLIDKDNSLGKNFDAFRYKKSGDYFDFKDVSDVQNHIVKNIQLKDGSIDVRRVRAIIEDAIDFDNVVTKIKLTDIPSFVQNNPNGYLKYRNTQTGSQVFVKGTDVDVAALSGIATDLEFYPKTTVKFLDDYILDPLNPDVTFGSKYTPGAYDLDPLETMKQVMDTVPKQFDDTTRNFSEVYKTLSNSEWVSGRGRDALNQYMRVYNGAAYQRLFTGNPVAFGINFAYWQIKTGGATLLGDSLGLTKISMYQLPESYSAFHIKHPETADIYEDAYVDFFANTGSDQGDLFMQFLNSGINWSNLLAKEVTGTIQTEWAKSLNNVIRKITEGQIRRSETDDIVLITDNLNPSCMDRCNYVIGAEYIEQATRDASMLMEIEMANAEVKEEDKLPEIVDSPDTEEPVNEEETNTEENTLEETNTENTQAEQEETQTESFQSTALPRATVSLKDITISTSVPSNITTLNYILENTTEKNYTKHGQTLISFSHHTDYDGTFSNQSTERAINLLDARTNEETCVQKIELLDVAGMPIGGIVPKSMRNHRFAGALVAQQHLAYLVFPGAGYFSSFVAPAVASDIPQMFLVMPQLHHCVDDQEGTYAHFFVSSLEAERVTKDSKNKVGEAIKEGVTKAEDAISKITAGTELEKGVKFGAGQVKEFAEQKLQENPIVQSTYRTSGQTDTTVKGQLFFFEMGPKTKCNAIGYNDKGVENLVDKDTNITLTIDKDKGEMTVIDANGNLKTIIGQENKDFVRLIGTNLGIPAKVVPRSLSYIPVPGDTDALFEIDAYGNFYVKNSAFLDCLRAGYEAQTGLTIPSGVTNLADYLGLVKLGNIVHPTTNYLIKPQNTQIMADGVPRLITNGQGAKVSILGNRITKIGPVDSRELTIGQNVAIQFERGQLVYVEEKKAYIMWVETTTVTHGNDIDKLKTELANEKATNGCDDTDEIGLNFNVTPDKDNDQAKANTDKLNKALEKVGPFQMFDTATKTFIFYVSEPPECEQRLKIIDKITGEVTDTKINSVQQTPTGLLVKTDDGKSHDLSFNAEEGVPTLTYNGDKETLLSAQGKEGAFWYDPETGNWYTTNGNLIPFNDKFKEGITFAVNPNGQVTGTPGNNVFNIGSGSGGASSGGFNIPVAPENKLLFIMYISIILLGFMFIYSRKK